MVLKFGILGAARIAPMALIEPSRKIENVVVHAIADRFPAVAQSFARTHSIATVHQSFDDLLHDQEIDAVYVALPNSLHCEWTIRALEAGKHVLCEKPLASNATQAKQMADAATSSGQILGEAFHYRHHPLAYRIKEIVDSGELGSIRHVEAHLNNTVLNLRDIRYSFELAGGALMDTGSYTVNLVRYLGGAEPRVTRASARCIKPQVDRWMEADFEFDDGRTGHITCSLLSTRIFRWQAVVIGDRGKMVVENPIRPQRPHNISVTVDGETRNEQLTHSSTFFHQLLAFTGAVLEGKAFATGPDEAIANLELIDAIYRQSGLKPRGS